MCYLNDQLSQQAEEFFGTGSNAHRDVEITMPTMLITLMAVFLALYFGVKRMYVLAALSLAAMFSLFKPEMWM